MKQNIALRAGSRGACALLAAIAALVPAAAWGAPPVGEPCTWHVQLAYHYHDSGPQGAHDTQAFLTLQAPLRCVGSGAETALSPDGSPAARGSARVTGDIPHSGGVPGTRDTYDKRLHWPAPGASQDFMPSVEVPSPSFVGTGFGTKVTLAGKLTGEARTAIAGADRGDADPSPSGGNRGPYTVLDTPSNTDRLDIALYFDPLPGTPSDPNGELGRVPQRTREALGVLGGEAALALKGHLFGAQTTYTSDGSFSICYRHNLVLAPAAVDIDFCGWLTRAGHDWTPTRLPPVEEAPTG
jgi:hypothetical protein